MKITIVHLYYDLLNINGEVGNIKTLEYIFNKLGIEVEVLNKTIGDKLDFKNYDFVFMGSGINENLIMVKDHLMKYKDQIKESIENNKFFLCEGNSYEIFGNKIENIDTLGIFDFESFYLKKNEVLEVTAQTNFLKKDIIGLINRSSYNNNKENIFLNIIKDDKKIEEGIHYKNFFGTYTFGPILLRNPELLMYIVNNLIKLKDKKFKVKDIDLTLFNEAYNDSINRRKEKVVLNQK